MKNTVAFAAVAIVGWSSITFAQTTCTAERGAPTPFGPAATAADSGRLYSYLLTNGGSMLYFFKRVGARGEDYRIFRSIRTGTHWSPGEQLDLGGDYSDLYPAIAADGSTLIFSSYRPAPGDTSSKRNAHLWMTRSNGRSWGAPVYIPASVPGHYHSGLRIDAQGNLHLHVTTPDWRQSREVMLRWNGERFADAFEEVPVHPVVTHFRRVLGDSMHVWGFVPVQGHSMLLSVSRVTQPGNRGPATYFTTTQRDGGFTPLSPAGGGLDRGAPNFAWVSSDGCYLHYTRDYSEFMRVPLRTVFR